jgi:predicted permease
MLQIILVILPVFLLIFVGQACRARRFPGEGFWAPAEQLTYYVLLPSLIVVTLAEADFAGLSVLPMALATAAAIVLMSALVLLLKPLLGTDGPGFTSVYQSVVRLNGYIGLSVAYGLYGETGLAASAVVVATYVPLVNAGATFMLARYGTAARPTVAGALGQVAANPLILACLAGGLLNLSGIGLPLVVGDMLQILGRAALPLGLLAVGAGLDLGAARAAKRAAALALALKLVVLPALTYGFALWFGAEGVALTVAVLFAALPVATSSYILARQLGGDAPLMANLCTLQTLVSMASLPLVLALLG